MGYTSSDPDCAHHQRIEERVKCARAAQSLLELHKAKHVCMVEICIVSDVGCQTDDTKDKSQTELELLRAHTPRAHVHAAAIVPLSYTERLQVSSLSMCI